MKIPHVILVAIAVMLSCPMPCTASASSYEEALIPLLGSLKWSGTVTEKEITIPPSDKRPEQKILTVPTVYKFEKGTVYLFHRPSGSFVFGRVDFSESASIDTVVKVEDCIRRNEKIEEIVFRCVEDRRRILAFVIEGEGGSSATPLAPVARGSERSSTPIAKTCSFEVAETDVTRGFVKRQVVQAAFESLGLVVVRGREEVTADLKITIVVTGEPGSSTSPGRCVFEYYIYARGATDPMLCRIELPLAVNADLTDVALESLNRTLGLLLEHWEVVAGGMSNRTGEPGATDNPGNAQ